MKNNKYVGVIEKHHPISPIIIDFDFRSDEPPKNNSNHLYNMEFIYHFIEEYILTITTVADIPYDLVKVFI